MKSKTKTRLAAGLLSVAALTGVSVMSAAPAHAVTGNGSFSINCISGYPYASVTNRSSSKIMLRGSAGAYYVYANSTKGMMAIRPDTRETWSVTTYQPGQYWTYTTSCLR